MPRVRDILIVATDPVPSEWYAAAWESHPPAGLDGGPVGVGQRITVERLDHDLAGVVMDASEPAGENLTSHRQWGQLHSVAREIDADEFAESHWNYDADGLLNELAALSRLVRDNAICTEYAARVIEYEDRRGSLQFSAWSTGSPTACASIGTG